MNEGQRIIYTEGVILQARIELEAMLAANMERLWRGESLAYSEKDMMAIITKYGIHHNALITNLEGR